MAERLTEAELAAIAARVQKATGGPWTVCYRNVGKSEESADYDDWFLGCDIEGPESAQRGQFVRSADARFIAHAREDVPRLLAYVRRLREALTEYGRHNEGCSAMHGQEYRCRCGWRKESAELGIVEGWPPEAPSK